MDGQKPGDKGSHLWPARRSLTCSGNCSKMNQVREEGKGGSLQTPPNPHRSKRQYLVIGQASCVDPSI